VQKAASLAAEIKYLTCPDDKKEMKKSDGSNLFI
jgi:hypothetical protein